MVFKDRPTIGVFTKELQDIYFYPILKGIRTECSRQKVNLRLFIGNLFDTSSSLDPNLVFYQADKENVDGIIVLSVPMPIYLDKTELRRFIETFSPLPAVNVGIEVDNIPSIIIENKKGCYDTVSHFVNVHRFKHIAHIGGPLDNKEAELRLEGYKQALADHGLAYDPLLYYEGDFLPHSGFDGCQVFFEQRDVTLDAIVCANDETAVGVLNYCRQNGISVPHELAVAGFDNLLMSNYTSVPLTTVSQPLFRTGVKAVELIRERIEKKEVPLLTVLPAHLMVRGSCGCTFTSEINGNNHTISGEKRALTEDEYQTIINIRDEAAATICESALIEKSDTIDQLGDYIVSRITAKGKSREEKSGEVKIDAIVEESYLTEDELNGWHDFLSLFYYKLKECPFFDLISEYVHTVFSAMVHRIDHAIRHKLSNSRASLVEDTLLFRRSMTRFNLSHSIKNFLKVASEELRAHGFNYFYIALWTGRENDYPEVNRASRQLQIVSGFDGKKIIEGCKPHIVYDRRELIPREYFKSGGNHSMLIFPLVQHEYFFGLFMVSYQEEKLAYYNPFWNRICVSLNLIRLLEEAEKKQQALNELNISLESKVEKRTAELVEANRKLQEIDRLKTNFFANISHELRTPLTLILGPMEGVYGGDYGDKIDHNSDIFKSVIKNGSRLLKLINNLLDIARIESGKMEINKKRTDIRRLVEYYLSIIRSSALRRDLEVVQKGEEKELWAWVDRDLMDKALFNLFSNALKFTSSGGKITITVTGQAESFSIAVADTGIGIPGDKLDEVFERFTQVDEGGAAKYQGTGIGLAFTKEIVELHRGTITADSIYGEGSVFTITLPYGRPDGTKGESETDGFLEYDFAVDRQLLAEDIEDIPGQTPEKSGDKAESEEEQLNWKNQDGRKKILVIDDNKEMRTFLTGILNKTYSVITGENGRVGLEKAAFHLPDLIISDVMMPVMNGIELVKQVKANDKLKHIPFILLTARTDMNLKIDGLEGEADDFLSKPFNARELLVRVKNLLTSRELQVTLVRQQEIITTGLVYAGKIQKSILPDPAGLTKVMKDHFVFWKPRDIVGGDIFWFKENSDSFLLAVIDCTGHGVPGAFMSMTAQAELDSIVTFINSDNPALILQELNKSIKRSLHQNDSAAADSRSDDGLDICLCYCNLKEKKLIYAGARRPLYYGEKCSLIEIKPDHMSIGYRSSGFDSGFTNHEIQLNGSQVFYLSTDGYEDQIGGKGGFSFGKRRLKKLFESICGQTMEQQRDTLENELQKYRGETKQVDDITVLAFIPRLAVCRT